MAKDAIEHCEGEFGIVAPLRGWCDDDTGVVKSDGPRPHLGWTATSVVQTGGMNLKWD